MVDRPTGGPRAPDIPSRGKTPVKACPCVNTHLEGKAGPAVAATWSPCGLGPASPPALVTQPQTPSHIAGHGVGFQGREANQEEG